MHKPAIGGSDRSGFEKAHRCLRVLQVDCFVWRAEGSIDLSRSFLLATWKVYCTGGAWHQPPSTGVWWDLNTCPVPADFDPLCVHRCIKSALHKQIRFPTTVAIYAIGNLEYISSDLLEKISSSGIVLIHAPCGGNSLIRFLYEWSDAVQDEQQRPGSGYIMLISGKVFVKEFAWETLLTANASPCAAMDEPLCICEICDVVYKTCNDFITHLKSEQHRETLFGIVPLDYGKPRYFCPVCNYPAYDEFNMSLHNESKDHNHKLADKEQDCESRKRNPQVDLFNEISKKQSLERA
ncbi:hypothetical protein F2Q68_00024060 [Brassica cretica]|uniref:C2H2-type domain-containing protein n=1 Tax=Brassica cretica TaxID=69181 RepID=A0A8S9IGS5_BRACR|nr:hypothetical protein F2Q68_00024060 [Brassica cretica]